MEKVETCVLFYRKGKKYYYVFDDIIYEVNNITINKLKDVIKLPYKIEFSGMSISQVQKVISNMLDDLVDVEFKKIQKASNNILRYEAIFYEKQRVVDVYKVSNASCLYGRYNNPNPYILTTISDKTILLEVPKDYIKNNKLEYYFLLEDLDESERDFFDSCYCQLKCHYVYKLSIDKENKFSRRKLNRKII